MQISLSCGIQDGGRLSSSHRQWCCGRDKPWTRRCGFAGWLPRGSNWYPQSLSWGTAASAPHEEQCWSLPPMEGKKGKELVLLECSLSLSSHSGLTGGMRTAVAQFRERNPHTSGKNMKINGLPSVTVCWGDQHNQHSPTGWWVHSDHRKGLKSCPLHVPAAPGQLGERGCTVRWQPQLQGGKCPGRDD